jgi:hypothetical protein
MNNNRYLKKINYIPTSKIKEKLKNLNLNGYCVIKSNKKFWRWVNSSPVKIRNITDKILKTEGLKAGSEGKERFTVKKNRFLEPGANRLSNLLNKHNVFIRMTTFPDFIYIAKQIIKKEFKISTVEFREPKKNNKPQPLHIDWYPRKTKSENCKMILIFVYLDNSNSKNGATQLVPKSHLKTNYPEKYGNVYKKFKNEKVVRVKKGDILILNSNIWHRGGSNISGKKRGLINIEYRARSLDQMLNLKKYISNKTKKKLNEYEKYLFAIRKEDRTQKSDATGPGDRLRKWLKKNPQYSYAT